MYNGIKKILDSPNGESSIILNVTVSSRRKSAKRVADRRKRPRIS